MREILAAGKKPATVTSAADAGVDTTSAAVGPPASRLEAGRAQAPGVRHENDGDFDAFASAVAAAVRA